MAKEQQPAVVAQTVMLPISKIETNHGQIDGLPKNPRVLRDEQYKRLKKSIEDNPEMLTLRELLVYPHGGKYVVIGGNMRLRILQDLGEKEGPCKIIAEDTSVDKLRAYTIKDNTSGGEWDWDDLANEWDADELDSWGLETPDGWGEEEQEEDEVERKRKEFAERMAAGEDLSDDEEYQEWLAKFEAKRTTDDCYTPDIVYDAVARWVSDEYHVHPKDFERPFYPGGDYKKHIYPKGCIVVDNPPFSILAEILNFYKEKDIKFFLFAPTLTLVSSSSSSSTALPCGVGITYENGATVNTSFLTNLEPRTLRMRSTPTLYKAVEAANDENLKSMHKELPKYSYPDEIVTAPMVAKYSKYGVEFSVDVKESEPIAHLDAQKEHKKAIYGKGYIVSEKAAAEKAAAEKAAAEKAAALRWELSERERAIVKKLSSK